MTDFLLELRSEEIPARMQGKARDDLSKLFVAELAKAGIAAGRITTYATPRRLTLIAHDLPERTDPVREEVKGPRASAPPQALEGFLRKTGLTREALTERDGVLFAITEKPGQETAAVLATAIPAIVRAFPWPKSMRWGAASLSPESPRWVRPLQGIVALFGETVIACEVAGVTSGAATVGHRFHHPGIITIGSAADYVEKLRACHVVVDQNERAAIIAIGAKMAAQGAGLTLIEDEGLLIENAGLTEWPVPLLGRFDPEFLSVPPEVIQLTARVNQKYFVCRAADGTLADAFVCTANIDAADGGDRIVEGNRKVLAARLSDAKFFYETDLKTPLDDLRPKLDKIVFHEKLGTVADKVDRVAKLARWLVEEGIVGATPLPPAGGAGGGQRVSPSLSPLEAPTPDPSREREGGNSVEGSNPSNATIAPFVPSDVEGRAASAAHGVSTSLDTNGSGMSLADMAERAAWLAKADLVTGMVGEFPELQGVMGGYYAVAQGEPRQVADAIRDHYKPVGQGDDVPTAPVTVAVALADKLDTLVSFWLIDQKPSGSKDPFALRRASLAIIQFIQKLCLRVKASHLFAASLATWWQDIADPSYVYDYSDTGRPLSVLGDIEHNAVVGIRKTKEQYRYSAGRTLENKESITRFEVAAGSSAESFCNFFADRLKVQQREAGVRHDLIDAVFALGGEDDLVRLLARVHALQAFVATEDGANLLAGYKRAANILKKEAPAAAVIPAEAGSHTPDGSDSAEAAAALDSRLRGNDGAYEPAEAALMTALDAAEPRAATAIDAEDFAGAMAALASLRGPIDAFFTDVTVNDADPAKRAHRLALLGRVRDAVHRVADFSKIEG